MSLPLVSVLMSTYNGEKFIREQIDSILKQVNVNVQLLIRDDGSSDGTKEIIQEYKANNTNVTVIIGSNVGVGKSFLELLRLSPDAEYYAFADQDDVWLEDKLERAVKVLRKAERVQIPDELIGSGNTVSIKDLIDYAKRDVADNIPMLYASNQLLVDASLTPIGYRFKTHPVFDFYDSLSRNIMYGCTMVMNHALRKIVLQIPLPDDKVLARKNHDAWVLYAAFITGVVIYDHTSKMKYRQHGGNVVGGIKPSGFRLIKDKYNRFTKKKNKGVRSMLAQNLTVRYRDSLSPQMKKHLMIIAQSNCISGAYKLCKDPVLRQSFHEKGWMLFLRGVLGWI